MSQCSLDGAVEVIWDNDSPTPAVWKHLQGPMRNDNDSGSPKLPRAMRRVVPLHLASVDCMQFEESKRAANRIIEALRQASREDECTQTKPIGSKLNIPDMADVEEESDNERTEQAVPFKTVGNSSLDVIFDMSGNGEDLAPTLKSNFSTQPIDKNLQTSDVWTDDDIFTEEALSQVDEEIKQTPKKFRVLNKDLRELPTKSSTPCDFSKAKSARSNDTEQRGKAKNFLNFMVDTAKPPRPSPKKHKSKILEEKKLTNARSRKHEPAPPTTVTDRIRCCGTVASTNHCAVAVKKEESKSADVSIPLEVLEDFMMDDSFADMKNLKRSPVAITTVVPPNFTSNEMATLNQKTTDTRKQCLKTAPKATRPDVTQSSTIGTKSYSLTTLGSIPQKCRKTENLLINRALSDLTGGKQHNFIDFNNSFSSDDEEMLLEAVALTESQRSQENSEAAENLKTTSSQPKCTASEIERKKQIALNRRKLKMKQKHFP